MSTVDIAALNRMKLQELHEDVARLQAERDRLRELLNRCRIMIERQSYGQLFFPIRLLADIKAEGIE